VGEPEEVTGEPVIAILQSNCLLICTPSRGVFRGMPILVGEDEVSYVEEFDPDPGGESK
jgi:hypothetical protein